MHLGLTRSITVLSGADSVCILRLGVCELDRQNIKYKSYSIMCNEKAEVITVRVFRRFIGAEFELIYPSKDQKDYGTSVPEASY
jgi:hypothetical protein